MGVRAPEARDAVSGSMYAGRPSGASAAAAVALGVVILLLLLSNGRPIESGDARVNARVAASLALEHDFDLDEYPDAELPFAREVGGRKVSIYPVLPAVLAAPVFLACRSFFVLDETGVAFAGKLAAASCSAIAASLLFLAISRRHPSSDARFAAVVFALGTSVWSTSQALWQHPAALLFLALALLFLLKAEDDPTWAGRAGLPLALVVAARHADVALVAVLAIGVVVRWPRRTLAFVAWGLGPVLFLAAYQWAYFGSPLEHGFSGTLGRFSEPWGRGHLGLLVSPAKGLLVFTPVAIVAGLGLLRALRREERWLPLVAVGAVLAHWLLMGRWSEWHGGESFGPRLMTDALPLLLLFLPEGVAATGGVGAALAALGIGVQLVGAFADDGRWERLYQRPAAPGHPELWNVADSPLPLYVRRGVLLPSLPALRDQRLVIREHPVVLFGARASRVRFEAPDRIVTGSADVTLSDLYLMRGARVDEGYLRLRGRWDGIFLRVVPEARGRRLELRLTGHGKGTLYVGERSFWSGKTRFREYAMSGPFRIRHAYQYADSGGGDLLVTTGRGDGLASLDSLALVPPSDPDGVQELR
jgi:hypothetical protein